MNEYLSFRTAHGIDTKEYKDLYLGDYFKIQDGTYNAVWMIAHFDYYYNRGDTASGKGIVLIPTWKCGKSKMFTNNETTGGYKASLMHTTTCPAIASALSTVLGSYLLSNKVLISNATNNNIPSMIGGNATGASTNWSWESVQAVLPTDIQIVGGPVLTSSYYDVGEASQKLAVFNFVTAPEFQRDYFLLRNIATWKNVSSISYYGNPYPADANAELAIRPLIYIG